jgi:hypothetical protein
MATTQWLRETRLLDYASPAIAALVREHGWLRLDEEARIRAVYEFVRDGIAFGYNKADDLPASQVLADGYGQCNTKGTLFMALLRALGIPCRLHGFTIDKRLQRGAVTGIFYVLAPREILHSWIEVRLHERWLNLEGFILDRPYLSALQARFDCVGAFCGYGVATEDFRAPPIEWTGGDTYIQHKGIVQDLGVFDDPDAFYGRHGTNLAGWKRRLYEGWGRHAMNRNVARIREGST